MLHGKLTKRFLHTVDKSQGLLYNILKNGLEKRGYKGMYVKTPTNGYHIYLWTRSAIFTQHGFNNF